MCPGTLPSCMSMCHLRIWSPWRLEEGIRSPGTGAAVWVLRIKPEYFEKALKFKSLVISSLLARGQGTELLLCCMLALEECCLWWWTRC